MDIGPKVPVRKNWIAGAVKHPGALHDALGIPHDQPIPPETLAAARTSTDPHIRRMANLADTLKSLHSEG